MPRTYNQHPFFVAVGSLPDAEPDEFDTTDMILAGFLLAEEHEPRVVGWLDGQCHWSFTRTDRLDTDVADFTGRSAEVEPVAMHNATNTARAAMFDSKP